MSARGKAGPGDVRRQLERAREPDSYDLEAGLRRHRELVARGAPPPAWAEGLKLRPRVSAGRWFMGLSALMMGTGALWVSQRAGSPVVVRPAAVDAVSGAPSAASNEAERQAVQPSVAPLAVVEAASPPALAPATPADGPVLGSPTAVDPSAAVTPAPAPSASATHVAPAVQAEAAPASSEPALHAARAVVPAPAAEPVAVLASTERVVSEAPRTRSASRAQRSVAPPPATPATPATPEPSLAELARQSVASAESAPSVPASRPSVVTAPARAVAPPSPPPATQAAPRHLTIEAERPGVVAEMQELSRAEAVLARDPGQALKLVQASMAEHPQGYLTEERRYVEVLALLGLRRVEEARLLGREFARLHPQSPYRRRVEAAIATALRAQ